MNKIDVEKTKNLAAGNGFRLEDIPIKKFFDQAQYLEKTLLPAIEKKSGKTSADYKFFTEVYKSMLYAVMILERCNAAVLQLQQVKQLSKIYQAQAQQYERELEKYTTIETVMFSGGLDHIINGVAERAKDLLTKK
jgi:hypothetical protein